jgi:hypothetical protein
MTLHAANNTLMLCGRRDGVSNHSAAPVVVVTDATSLFKKDCQATRE